MSVSNTQQVITSADIIYSTVDEDNRQNVLQDNPAYLSLKRTVAAFDKC